MMNEWRHLSACEKDLLRKYLSLRTTPAIVFFRIPQLLAIVVTVALVIEVVKDWNTYSQDILQLVGMLFSLPFLWGMFFVGPMFLIKAVRREVNALDNDTAMLCERLVWGKHVGFEGSSASGHARRVYKFGVFDNGVKFKDRCVTTNERAYNFLKEGENCWVVWFPRSAGEPEHTAFMMAFCVNFAELQVLFEN